jgi:glucuronate isomerase
MFLSADHYKWRLMRAYGIDEKYITGNAPDGEKFAAYIAAVEGAYGNPLRDFTRLELSKYFGIDPPLKSENSKKIRKAADEESIRELTTEREKIDRIEEIRKAADAVIREKSLSPRKLIASSNVEYIATTDDPADPLFYHEKIKEIENFSTKVVPTFRADRLFNIKAADFAAYLERFSGICGLSIASFEAFLYAIDKRIADFKAAGCSFADIGIEDFPSAEFVTREKNTEKTAEKAYKFVENCADKCLKNLEKTDKFDQKTAEKCLKNAEKTAEFEQKTAEKCLKNAEKPCKFDQKNA